MDVGTIGLLLGSSWGSGVNLYLTTAGLGIAHRMEWITLPGNMDTLAHPLVIAVAVGLYMIEFVADKIPYVDSAWDSVHTFIRPLGAVSLGLMAMGDVDPAVKISVGLLTGSVALSSHLTKATSRAAINTSPEPFSNTAASVAEDASVVGILYLIINHPFIAAVCVVLFFFFSFWFLKMMFRFIKKIFSFSGKNKGLSSI